FCAHWVGAGNGPWASTSISSLQEQTGTANISGPTLRSPSDGCGLASRFGFGVRAAANLIQLPSSKDFGSEISPSGADLDGVVYSGSEGQMESSKVLRAWAAILAGRKPNLSIEITRECPLRCPGCYAYDDAHLSGQGNLRSLSDYRGAELVQRVLQLVDEYRPLHLSIVGGDPLVRYRELDELIPRLHERQIHTQVVTSAFRKINPAWAHFSGLTIVVSVDGLQPEHDLRRKPATYERILENIAEIRATVHSTIPSQMTRRSGYIPDFVEFWSR